jgi:hypothetical protein
MYSWRRGGRNMEMPISSLLARALTLTRSLVYPLLIDPRIAGQVGARQCTHRIIPARQSQMQS